MSNLDLGRLLLEGRNLVKCARFVAARMDDNHVVKELVIGSYSNLDIKYDDLTFFFTRAFGVPNWCKQSEDDVYATVTRQAIIASMLPRLQDLEYLGYHNFCHVARGKEQANTAQRLQARLTLPPKLKHIAIICQNETAQVSFPITQMTRDTNVSRLTVCRADAINLPLQQCSFWHTLETLELLECDISTLDLRALVTQSPNLKTLNYTQKLTGFHESRVSLLLKASINACDTLEALYLRSGVVATNPDHVMPGLAKYLKLFKKLKSLRMSQIDLGLVGAGVNSKRLNPWIRKRLANNDSILYSLPKSLQVLRVDDVDFASLPQLLVIPETYKTAVPGLQRVELGIERRGTMQKKLQKALRMKFHRAGLELKFKLIDTPHRPWRI